MINFLKGLWPSNTPPYVLGKDQIAILRERILQTLLLSTFVLFAPVYGLLINIAFRNNAINDITFLTGIFIGLLVLILTRKLAYVPRALSLVIILFLVGTISLILFGNSGSGFLLLIIFVRSNHNFAGAITWIWRHSSQSANRDTDFLWDGKRPVYISAQSKYWRGVGEVRFYILTYCWGS